MFDTGNNDKTITDPDGWWGPLAKGFGLKMTKDDAIPVQLAKIGLKPDDIKYVAVGHLHLDHGGNVGQFKNSTLIAQDDEFKAAWWPDVGFSLYYIPGDFAETKNMKTIRLNGDFDLFKRRHGETDPRAGPYAGQPVHGRQAAKTGTAILTSDVVYLQESLDKNLIPRFPARRARAMPIRATTASATSATSRMPSSHRPRPELFKAGEEGPGVLRLTSAGTSRSASLCLCWEQRHSSGASLWITQPRAPLEWRAPSHDAGRSRGPT